MKHLILLFLLCIPILSSAQVYEEIRISDEERAKSRTFSNGLMISAGHAIPILGLRTGFSNGLGIKLKYVHEISRVWIKGGIEYKIFKGKSPVIKFGGVYDFEKLNSINLTTGIYIPIDISESFVIAPSLGSGWGFSFHKRIYTSNPGSGYVFLETVVVYTFPINFGVNFQYIINDKVGIFIEPEMSFMFSLGMYSGFVDGGYSDFSAKEDILNFNYITNIGLTFFFNRD